ncbi:uncharacterized protein LOC128955245 [Oppia nitens]|uniref:uncharacterized protein LOC128955245 n=1 Tax=Oppia nitens TaxID=1686743 RepID=UPI0023DCB7D7|nr:uncharacterized protein LOC128955245 [Oppia nitens]
MQTICARQLSTGTGSTGSLMTMSSLSSLLSSPVITTGFIFITIFYTLLLPQIHCAPTVPTTGGANKCPDVRQQPSAYSRQCRCSTNSTGHTVIVCNGDDIIDMNNYFVGLSQYQSTMQTIADGNDGQQHHEPEPYDQFVLNNTAVTELGDQFLGNVTFKSIHIKDAFSLGRIAANAFGPNWLTVEELVIDGESQLGASGSDRDLDELFDALSSLVEAKRIWLNRNHLRQIPSVAFGKYSGQDYRLVDLNFNRFSVNNGHIQSIGNYAFYYLNQLRHLYLSHQRLDYVPANAFDFERPSNQTLYIYMGNNRLNNTSFERGVLLNAKRPVHLELYWNPQLTYLDETIFAPFLRQDKRNHIRLGDQPLACDCKSYWMVRDKDGFGKQISNAKCKVGPNKVFSIDLIPFDQCRNKMSARLMASKSRRRKHLKH